MEPDRRIRRIAIVGGGIAGWTAAAMLARKLGGQCSIHVVDSAEAATPGFGEATQPVALELLKFLGADQNDFVDKTQSTYCLGTRFTDWAEPGQSFWHPFGAFGALVERRPFYHFWHKARALGLKPRMELFSLEAAMGSANRFIFPTNTLGVAQHMRYALHMDRALAARHLRSLAERAGVIRLERKVVSASQREDGFLDELRFERIRQHRHLVAALRTRVDDGQRAALGWSDALKLHRAVARDTEEFHRRGSSRRSRSSCAM